MSAPSITPYTAPIALRPVLLEAESGPSAANRYQQVIAQSQIDIPAQFDDIEKIKRIEQELFKTGRQGKENSLPLFTYTEKRDTPPLPFRERTNSTSAASAASQKLSTAATHAGLVSEAKTPCKTLKCPTRESLD